jgi:sugar/nucleoside kinase (ribokinase family)
MSVEVAVVGGPFLDLVFVGLPRLPGRDEEVVGRGLRVVPGGTAIQAIGLARLGVGAGLVAPRAGDLAGRLLAEVLDREGVAWTGPTASRTAATAVLSSRDGVAMATSPGDGEPGREDVTAAGAPTVVLSLGRAALRPPGTRACFVTGSVEVERGVGLPSCEPGDLLVANEREATALTGEATGEDAAAALTHTGATGIVTAGDRGAVAVRDGAAVRAPAPEVEVADATGAGDLFVAAIVWASRCGLDLEAALAWACLYAGLSVASPTALDGARRLPELIAEGRRRGLTPP